MLYGYAHRPIWRSNLSTEGPSSQACQIENHGQASQMVWIVLALLWEPRCTFSHSGLTFLTVTPGWQCPTHRVGWNRMSDARRAVSDLAKYGCCVLFQSELWEQTEWWTHDGLVKWVPSLPLHPKHCAWTLPQGESIFIQSRSPKASQCGVDVDISKIIKLPQELDKLCPGKFSQEAIVKRPHSSELNLKNVPTKAQWEFYVRKG